MFNMNLIDLYLHGNSLTKYQMVKTTQINGLAKTVGKYNLIVLKELTELNEKEIDEWH